MALLKVTPPSRGEFKGFFIELLGVECIAKVRLNLVSSLEIHLVYPVILSDFFQRAKM